MPTLARKIKDEFKLARIALPAQNANVNSAAIDLENVPLKDDVQFNLSLVKTPNLANGQTITGKVQDSADNVTFADVAIQTLVVTGVSTDGGPEATLTVRVPLNIRRYVRANWAASATAGNNTAISGEFALVF